MSKFITLFKPSFTYSKFSQPAIHYLKNIKITRKR